MKTVICEKSLSIYATLFLLSANRECSERDCVLLWIIRRLIRPGWHFGVRCALANSVCVCVIDVDGI